MTASDATMRANVLVRLALALLLTAVGPLAQAWGQPATGHSATVPAERDGGARQRFEMLNQRVAAAGAAGRLDLLFVGDSITQGWENEGKAVWARFYGGDGSGAPDSSGGDAPGAVRRRALNIGIGGDRTQHVLWRLDHGNIDGIAPRVAVVMIGTNNSNGEDNSVAEIADGVRAVVSKLRQKLPATKIILLDIFPRGQQPNPQRGKICQVNQVIARLHDGRDVFFAPIGHHFLADDGSLSPEIMPDSLHLSPRGYEIWAQALEPHLKALLSDSAR